LTLYALGDNYFSLKGENQSAWICPLEIDQDITLLHMRNNMLRNWISRNYNGPGGIREILPIAFPMMVSSACDTVMIFTNRLFLARIDSIQMSAAMGGGVSFFLLLTFFIGLTGYSSALVAQYLGAGEDRKCAVVITQAVIISVIAYPLLLLGIPWANNLFALSGISPEQLAYQKTYFNIMASFCIFSLLRNVLSCFFSGIGRTQFVMFAAFTAMIVNAGFNYIMIFGKLGFPAMGIAGAAYGTTLANMVALGILLLAYFSRFSRYQFHIRQSFRFDRVVMKKLFRYGLPAGIEIFFNFSAFAVMVTLFHATSPSVAVAATILFNWDLVSVVPLIGLGIGVTSLVGRHMGAKRPDLAKRSALSGVKSAWIYSICLWGMFFFFPSFLVDIFQPSHADPVFTNARPIAIQMTRLVSVYVLLDAVIITLAGALRGAGDTVFTMITFVFINWLMVIVVYILLRVFDLGAVISWTGAIGTLMLLAVILIFRFKNGKWQNMNVLQT